jgi:coenzyme Q-binding protein COQ10
MPKHSETRVLPYSAQQMYGLVADVARYPEFLPWCAAARVRQTANRGGAEVLDVDLVISFKVFRERFGSRVTLWPDQMKIDTDYLDGPFKYMQSTWAFREATRGCEVDFAVDFEFRNAILQKVVGLVFDQAMRRIVRAFEARAEALYGTAPQR